MVTYYLWLAHNLHGFFVLKSRPFKSLSQKSIVIGGKFRHTGLKFKMNRKSKPMRLKSLKN